MAFKRITENDMLGKGNVGKPDTPGVSTSEMQRIMDELPREVIAPAFNELSGQLEANTASADIGANAPDGITPDPAPAENSPAKLQSVLQGIVNKITDHIADQVKHVTSEERTLWNNASNDRHTHDNKSILDGITSSLVGNWNAAFAHVSDAVRHITENERTNWNDKYTKSETDKAINERVVEIGSSDMTKAVYDPETRNLPYIPKIDAEALTLGKNVVLSGTPVSIAYAGAQRIASITAYGETPQGGTTEAPVALTGISSVTVNDDVTELPIPRPLRRVGDVRDVCVTRQEYEGTEKLVVTYNVGFVELDGTEDVVFDTYGNTQKRIRFDLDRNAIARYALKFSHGNPGDTPTVTGGISASFNRDVLNRLQIICSPDTWTVLGVTDTATAKTWLAAQKAAGTPVQIAYQLATPETYATDPLDFDNAAGPLIVMTGGEVVVRMTELVGSRSPEIVAKMDKTVYAQVGNPSELDNDNFLHCVNQRNVSGTISTSGYFIDRWKLISGTVQITENGLVLNGTISQILENAAGTDVTASSSAGAASYDNSTKTFTLTATGQTITWAKLEKGSVATPYVPKGYGAELAECLRYFQRVHADWRIYPTLKDMLYRFSQSTLQVMRIKPTISAHGTPYTFGCTINALDAQPMAFTVETKITEQGQNSAAASMLGYFDLSADL